MRAIGIPVTESVFVLTEKMIAFDKFISLLNFFIDCLIENSMKDGFNDYTDFYKERKEFIVEWT